MVLALTCSVYGQSNRANVPFDLPQFQPVLSESRLHSPRTSNPIAVRRGQFRGYELPGRFYLGEGGTTMVLGTLNVTPNGRERTELRHNVSWSVGAGEKHLSARLQFDKPTALEGRSRLHLVQVYGVGDDKGPMVLVSWAGSREAGGREDNLTAYVRGGKSHNLGRRPEGFFDLDVKINDGKVRFYVNNQLKAEDDVSSLGSANAFFKVGNYSRGIAHPQTVEFERLTIVTP